MTPVSEDDNFVDDIGVQEDNADYVVVNGDDEEEIDCDPDREISASKLSECDRAFDLRALDCSDFDCGLSSSKSSDTDFECDFSSSECFDTDSDFDVS